MLRRWTANGNAIYELQNANTGFGIEVTIQLPWLSRTRLVIRVFLLKDFSCASALSLKATVSLPVVVDGNTETIAATRTGDIALLTQLFKSKKARLFDTLKNGNSLLHVCLSVSTFQYL